MSPALQGLLRVPLGADGAVGRPGVDRVHRRRRDWRRARPQRPASVALLRHARRPGGHGLGSRRPRLRARGHPHQGAPASRDASSSSTRRRAASSRTRRSSTSSRRRTRTRDGCATTSSHIDDLPTPPYLPRPSARGGARSGSSMFGYTRRRSAPAARRRWRSNGEEPIGSMGTDTRAGGAVGSPAPALRLFPADSSRRSPTRRSTRSASSW